MRSNLDEFFSPLTDKLVFIELEDKLILDKFGKTESDFMVPVFSKDIVSLAQDENSGIKTMQIAEAILYLIGIDSNFKYNDHYIYFLKNNVEKPENLSSYIAKSKYENKNYKDALVHLRAAMLLDDKNLGLIYNYAHICKEYMIEASEKEVREALMKESEEFFEAVLDIDDEHVLANYQLAYFKLNKGDTKSALKHLERAANNPVDNEIAQEANELIMKLNYESKIEQVEALIDELKLEEALDIIDDIPEIEEDKNLEFRLNYAKGFCLKAFSNFEEAIEAYEKALMIDNTDTLLLCELGICYAYIGEFAQSLEFYMSALDIEPESVEIMSNISIIYLNMKDIENAKLYVKKAMEINPLDEIIDATVKEIRKMEETMK
ncbi:MAG: tetratricopeptide repeat protein [Proteocatella sp.]